MLTETRPFPSKSGQEVPQILPDLKSDWHKIYPKVDQYLNLGTFREELDGILSISQPLEATQILSSNSSETQTLSDDWNLLGMRAFKTTNETMQVFNILSKSPKDMKMTTADFDQEARAHLPYSYARTVEKSDDRIEDNGKLDVKEWVTNDMPEEPFDKAKGFAKGSAEKWFKKCHKVEPDADIVHVLERVLNKSDIVMRPDISAYANIDQRLQPDQAVLDSLPTEEFFTSVSNSNNLGCIVFTKTICISKLLI